MVKVIAKSGVPLHDTKRHGKVRHLLKNGNAVIVSKEPFTIQLAYEHERGEQSSVRA